MSVALGGGNGCVPQELLDDANVGSVTEEQRRHRVTQHVRSYVPLNAGLSPQLGDDLRHSLSFREPLS